ncbi:MAG: TlyA family RNA methyltransferase [bacterium]|nr:TlyA family RNA methyltransferase [bacterium]
MAEKKEKKRIDSTLVERGLVSSRTRGEALIKEGGVAVNGAVVKNKSFLIEDADEVALLKEDLKWVSRGALKLEHALDHWKIDPKGKTVLDIGASTGGFTEVLLSHGAKLVYALDVGHGQLAEKLRSNPRVVNMEGVHINNVTRSDFEEPIDVIVVDVSFISLEKILPKIKELLRNGGELILLVKPQFEVGKSNIKKGIVFNPKLHASVVARIESALEKIGFSLKGVVESPILGGNGNKEFLLYARLSGKNKNTRQK